jgi:hypothetical protein
MAYLRLKQLVGVLVALASIGYLLDGAFWFHKYIFGVWGQPAVNQGAPSMMLGLALVAIAVIVWPGSKSPTTE